MQNREALAEAGYGYKSRWLAYWMLHLLQKATQISSHIPAALWRLGSACSLTLNPQNFDYTKRKRFPPLRMTG